MRIAVVEDDEVQREALCRILRSHGHACFAAAGVKPAMLLLRRSTFDLVILDWVLPQGTGLDLVAWARANLKPVPPILMLTARGDEGDMARALELGADDYVVKPVLERLLIARVTALMRRSQPAASPAGLEVFAGYAFDARLREATWGGEQITLTAKEFDLALMLFRNLDRALSRNYILESIWGWEESLSSRTLDTHISRIRSKLGLRPQHGFRLAPVYGYGYRLEEVARS
ncbi:response regulator transcription factor [soil metagenome]